MTHVSDSAFSGHGGYFNLTVTYSLDYEYVNGLTVRVSNFQANASMAASTSTQFMDADFVQSNAKSNYPSNNYITGGNSPDGTPMRTQEDYRLKALVDNNAFDFVWGACRKWNGGADGSVKGTNYIEFPASKTTWDVVRAPTDTSFTLLRTIGRSANNNTLQDFWFVTSLLTISVPTGIIPMGIRRSGSWQALNTVPGGFVKCRKSGLYIPASPDGTLAGSVDTGLNRIRRDEQWKCQSLFP